MTTQYQVTPGHGHWMETCSGRVVDLLDPQPESISLQDIAWHLANQARWNGATNYSVADHSCWVAHYLYLRTGDASLALQGLFHDAYEAYIGNIITSITNLPELHTAIVALQARLQTVICQVLDLPLELPAIVVEADHQARVVEASVFLPSQGKHWLGVKPDTFALALAAPRPRLTLQGARCFVELYNHLQRVCARGSHRTQELSP